MEGYRKPSASMPMPLVWRLLIIVVLATSVFAMLTVPVPPVVEEDKFPTIEINGVTCTVLNSTEDRVILDCKK